jgi:hypothetical protein
MARRKEKLFARNNRKYYYKQQMATRCDAKNDSRKFCRQVNGMRDGFQAMQSSSAGK